MSCSVRGCKSVRRLLLDEKISFHTFPRELTAQRNWLNALQIDPTQWTWTKSKVVCCKHFTSEDFIQLQASRKDLKPNAVPSVHLKSVVEDSNVGTSSTHEVSLASTPSFNISSEQSTISVDSDADKKTNRLLKKRSTPVTASSSTSDGTIKRRKTCRKITLGKTTFSSDKSTSTDSSTQRRRMRIVKEFHSYSASPSTLKRKSEVLKQKHMIVKRKLYTERYKTKKLKQKVTNLKMVINSLKKENHLSENSLQHVQKTYDSIPALLMARHLKNIQNQTTTHETYPAPLREFAATLHFYSNKAYNFVREEFSLALPHPSTLRKWYANVDCSPGFITPVFDCLQLKSEEAKANGNELICSLMIDEMSIRKQIEFDNNKVWGYVNIGVPTDNDELHPASEVLVIMVVANQGYWKLPIGYFFVKGLSGEEKANIVNESLQRLHNVGVTITSLTSDGPSANFAMFTSLGCSFDNVYEMKTFFQHPSDPTKKVFAILDPCHMIKLVRNSLENLMAIRDPDGKHIEWKYIKLLHDFQEKEGLSFGTKIKQAHINFKKQKMKVYLAAQIFSRSTADALIFLKDEMNIPEFKECEATASFLIIINDVFDLLNSRNPYNKGFKGALRESNEANWRPYILNAVQYILGCTDVGGRPLWMTPKKTPFIGLCVTAISTCGIFDEVVKTGKLNYLLTYKFSQDHLEILFCAIRGRNGWNNNPSALHFMRTLRKILLFSKISGKGGNCRVLDTTTVLTVSSGLKTSRDDTISTIDVGLCRKYGIDVAETFEEVGSQCEDMPFIPFTELTANVVAYISGFVVRSLSRRTHCVDCILECYKSKEGSYDSSYKLLLHKDRGGLIIPSESVVKICLAAEKTIRKVMMVTGNKIPDEKTFFSSLTISISQSFYSKVDDLFQNLVEHFLENAPDEEHHGFSLIKNIVSCYCKIRIYNLAKKYTEKVQGLNVRRQLTKLVLFNHQ